VRRRSRQDQQPEDTTGNDPSQHVVHVHSLEPWCSFPAVKNDCAILPVSK
jgi:hypothetical protein